jgi:hypothetical protein
MKGAALFATACLLLAGCAGPADYEYRYVPGRTAVVHDGVAIAPPSAPPRVLAMIDAGNQIAGLPYRRGGGHGRESDGAYDCSGAVSHLLRAGGAMRGSMPSTGFRRYGAAGEGEWVSVYARRGHVFAVVAGLRFDTGYGNGQRGPQWTTRSRPAKGYVIRHPTGL